MFDDEWENTFFFIENMDDDAQCLICNKIISEKSLYYIKRHYDSCHGNINKLNNSDRTLLLLELKAKFFLTFMVDETDQDNGVILINEDVSLPYKKASYIVALSLAKQCRPFTDGIFLKIYRWMF